MDLCQPKALFPVITNIISHQLTVYCYSQCEIPNGRPNEQIPFTWGPFGDREHLWGDYHADSTILTSSKSLLILGWLDVHENRCGCKMWNIYTCTMCLSTGHDMSWYVGKKCSSAPHLFVLWLAFPHWLVLSRCTNTLQISWHPHAAAQPAATPPPTKTRGLKPPGPFNTMQMASIGLYHRTCPPLQAHSLHNKLVGLVYLANFVLRHHTNVAYVADVAKLKWLRLGHAQQQEAVSKNNNRFTSTKISRHDDASSKSVVSLR